MKKINPKVLENQNKYNAAFDRWKSIGYLVPSADYHIIFNCIYETCKGVIRSSVKKWDDEADDKAIELASLIVERDEIKKHYKIDSLGAWAGVCKLGITISKKTQFYDKQRSYEEMVENGYDGTEEENTEEKLDKTYYSIDNNNCSKYLEDNTINPKYDEKKIKQYKIDDIKDPDKLFEILFN